MQFNACIQTMHLLSFTGLLYEATSSYSYSFYLGGGAWVGSAIAALFALCHRRKTLIEETTIEEEETKESQEIT